jgi:hypothetical protein
VAVRVGLLLTASALLLSATARAEGGLSADETQRLLRGQTIARQQQMQRRDERYVGGVTYTIIDGGVDELAALVDDVDSWGRILPRTRDVRRVGAAGEDALVEVTHGSAIVQAKYTMRVRREGHVVRFWLDRSRAHDIEDAWGFFRVEPMPDGRALVTYGVLIDMGAGLLRDLFEERVRELALTVPERVRDAILERRAAERRASL